MEKGWKKTYFLDPAKNYGKKILRKKERDNLINHIEKAAKDPGVRKLTDRIKTRFIGCSEKQLKLLSFNLCALSVYLS